MAITPRPSMSSTSRKLFSECTGRLNIRLPCMIASHRTLRMATSGAGSLWENLGMAVSVPAEYAAAKAAAQDGAADCARRRGGGGDGSRPSLQPAFAARSRSSATSVRRTWMVSPACSVALSRPGPISLRMDARCPVLVGVSTWLPAPCAAHSAASDWRRDCCCPRLGVRGVVPVPPVGAPGDVKSGESRGVGERLGGVELGM